MADKVLTDKERISQNIKDGEIQEGLRKQEFERHLALENQRIKQEIKAGAQVLFGRLAEAQNLLKPIEQSLATIKERGIIRIPGGGKEPLQPLLNEAEEFVSSIFAESSTEPPSFSKNNLDVGFVYEDDTFSYVAKLKENPKFVGVVEARVKAIRQAISTLETKLRPLVKEAKEGTPI